ncbi:interleukin-12 subunit alpha isoform X2 [Tachysurus fulvidraco]|uniref:interleukin-12 subunit alpha isoform X2 n=1 Tax=Tachysurus fulvidraco TaxID=1234273 RepID=UPI000F510EE3|nr:interleukin-12 subunit alpha isoform X2 [Tachysurus fulvidraco]
MYGYFMLMCIALVSRAAVASPVRASRSVQSDHELCTTSARSLLTTLRRVLEKSTVTQPEKMGSNTLFHGFNCTDLGAVMNPNTQTASVCQPIQDVTCSDEKTSPFSQTKCLQNIANDLHYHETMLDKYVKTLDERPNDESVNELRTLTESIQYLQQRCKLLPKPETSKNMWTPTNSFEDRMDLCKQLKGFQVRTITINRALGYICAGE